ncbi:MAG: hypothetical protein IBX40_11725 [Methanosarcinales archaeon]|nr:hypothetical protein [Methanosarcinales archaeon]
MKIKTIIVGVIILIFFSNLFPASAEVVIPLVEPEMEYPDMEADFDKLQISPRYENIQLEPGESKTITFKVKNTGDKAVTTDITIEIPPFSEYFMEMDWITVNPLSVIIEPDESREFEVTVDIPEGTVRGYYSAQIAFTNDTLPTPYPSPYPNYINAAQLSVDVWVPPVIQISSSYIHDQIEAGKTYNYDIKLENTGDDHVEINPEVDSSNRYEFGPNGLVEPPISDEDIFITSPSIINPGEIVIVKVEINVPQDAKGYYNGAIDLNIDDPSLNEWEGRMQLDFQIWKQPTEPYVKTFNIDTDAPVTIDIISDIYDSSPESGSSSKNDPSFDVTINGPDASTPGDIKPSKIVIGGSVDLGSERFPPWEMESEGLYQETRTQYIETYTLDGTAGDWTLSIMPYHTSRFDYSIQIGE